MATDRSKRRIERLLDEADEAVSQLDWELVRNRAQAVLAFEPDNSDAWDLLNAADWATGIRQLPCWTSPWPSQPNWACGP